MMLLYSDRAGIRPAMHQGSSSTLRAIGTSRVSRCEVELGDDQSGDGVDMLGVTGLGVSWR
jgi:hypothetical protein